MARVEACLFVGPTLALREVPGLLVATCLPPVRQGDVFRAVSFLEPRAIGIIDGYFQWVPSVWHKEILWAIKQGVHVFGASSMGALRAAELAAFGMHGVGRIFEAYRDGRFGDDEDRPFEDDDEVAVAHGPAELGYPALSEAMVNIRCTLANAKALGVIGETTCAGLVAIAKAQFFPERGYATLLDKARAAGLNPQEVSALASWLPAGRVDQKRADALALLETMQRFLATDPQPARAAFSFEHTSLWDRSVVHVRSPARRDTEDSTILDELRLRGERYDTLRHEALASLAPEYDAEASATETSLAEQLSQHHAAPDQIEKLFANAQRLRMARETRAEIASDLVERQMLARLAGMAELDPLRARAVDKAARLAEQPALPDAIDLPELQLLQLRDWYFSKVLVTDMPDDLDRRICDWGYADATHFHRTLLREYVYRKSTAGEEQFLGESELRANAVRT